MIWQLVGLLAVHWFADFVLQTPWQASNKSKSNYALLCHVATYTLILAGWTIGAFGGLGATLTAIAAFVLANGALHFVTDWCTSRITSRLFIAQFDTFEIVVQPPSLVGGYSGLEMVTEKRLTMKKDFNPHNFFVVVGIDQLIHQVTLASTMVLFFGR
jgi:Protein of unknown function (DUF3307)